MKSEWNNLSIGDVIDLVIDYRGKTPKKLGGDWSETGYRALSAKNIKTGNIVQPDTIRYVNEDIYKKWMKEEVCRGDILITSEAPFGQILFWDSDEKIVLSQRLFGLRIKEIYYPRFIYYAMTTTEFQAELDAHATGTTVIGLRQPELLKCRITCPNYSTQKQIAQFLSSIDDRISLNQKINDNLEQQAQALFKEYFANTSRANIIGEIPLSELCNVVTKGTTPTTLGKHFTEQGINFIKAESISDSHNLDPLKFAHIDDDTHVLLKRSIIQDKDIIFTIAGTLGRFALVDESILPANTNQAVAIIRANPNIVSPYYLYSFFIGNWHNEYYSKHVQQAVQANLSLTTIKSLPIPILSDNTMKEYLAQITPVFESIKNNEQESRALSNLRDVLLPKLMSGDIDVSDISV